MPQGDMNVANDSGANVRADINDQLAALVQLSSGGTAPATTFAHMLWADTTPSGYTIVKIRDAADAVFSTLFDDEGRWKGSDGTAAEPSISFGADVDLGLYRIAANVLGINASAGVGIGIGSTSPDGELHVHKATAGAVTAPSFANLAVFEDSTQNGISILVPDAQNAMLNFGSPSDNDAASLVWSHDGGNFEIRITKATGGIVCTTGGGATAMTIDANQDITYTGAEIHTSETITTDTTPTAVGRRFIIIGAWTAANDITDFDNEADGQRLTILGGDGDCNVVDGAPIQLVGGVTWNGAAGATLELISDGTIWYELSRSDAS